MVRIFVFLFLVFPFSIFCQSIETQRHRTVVIEFFDKPPIIGKDARLTEDSLNYRINHTQHYNDISLENVMRIKEKTGTYAGKGFGWGLGFGVGYSIAEAMYINLSPQLVFRENAISRYLVFTGICAAGGALIGALIPIHKTIYLGSLPPLKTLNLQLKPYSDFQISGLSVVLEF